MQHLSQNKFFVTTRNDITNRPWKFYFNSCKILIFLHVYSTKFIKNIYFFTNFEFSHKFSVKSQNFLHIEIVPIMYEWGKVEKVPGNKILYRSILEQCGSESFSLASFCTLIFDYIIIWFKFISFYFEICLKRSF